MDNNSFIQHIAENCISETTGIFDEVYKSFIIQFLLDIEIIVDDFVEKNRVIKVHKERVLKKLAKSYKQVLIQICEKTLIVEINNHEESLVGSNEEEKYSYFVNTFMEKNFDRVFAPGSSLMNIISTKEYALCNSLRRFFEHFYEDIEDIESLMGKRICEINEISIGDGDTHNGGKSVYIVTLNDKDKLVYKPHTLINDVIFSKVLEIVNKQDRLRLKLQHVKFSNQGDHGWQLFVKKASCSDESEVEDYMYRFGCYVFLCYLLNCTDMHFENIIAAKDHPYLIDIETLFTNQYVFNGARWEKASSFERQLCNSVFGSVLLPMNIAGMKEGSRLELSGLEGGIRELNVKSDIIVNPGRSDIGYETMDVRVDDKLNLNNAVTLDGKKVLPELYLESLIKGFRDCYLLFLDADVVDKIVGIRELEFGKFRQVLRNTKLYYKYLDASYHPYYMNHPKGRSVVFGRLCGSGIVSREHSQVVSAECLQLLREDIPYFYTGYKTRNLYSADGLVAEDFFQQSIEKVFKERIQSLSQRDLIVQEYFIRTSVYGKSDVRREVHFDLNNKGIHSILSYISNVHEINNADGNADYFNIVEEGDRYCIGTLPFYLYKGGGMAFSLLGLYKSTKNANYLESFKRLKYIGDVPIAEIYKYNKSLGMFDGCGSLLYLAYNAVEITKDIYYSNKFSEYLDFYESVDITQYVEMDIISGCAGILLFLSNVYEKSRDDQVLRVMKKFNDRLLTSYMDNTLPKLTGFAHGFAGVGLALLKAASNLGNQLSYEAGLEVIREEDKYYLKESNNWIDLRNGKESMNAWCYGVAGILLSRIEAFKYVYDEHKPELHIDITRSIERLKNYAEWADSEDILCHGTLGNLDALRHYHTRFELTDDYELISREIDRKVRKHGLKGKNAPGVNNIDFMEGISGYLYHQMRKIDNKMPCILLLEIF